MDVLQHSEPATWTPSKCYFEPTRATSTYRSRSFAIRRVYQARAHFDRSREFGTWARRISTNTAIDYLKIARPGAALIEEGPAVELAEQDELRAAPGGGRSGVLPE